MRRRHRSFGLPYETHRTKFEELIAQGFSAARTADSLLRDGACGEAFDHLLTVRDRLSRAQMHLVSSVDPGVFSPESVALNVSRGRMGDLNMQLFSIAQRFRAGCMHGRGKRR